MIQTSRYGIQKGATEYVIFCCKCDHEGVCHTYSMKNAVSTFREMGWKLTSEGSVCTSCQTVEKYKNRKTCRDCKHYECVHYKGTPEDELYDECTYHNEVLHDVEICGNFEDRED